MSDPIRIEDIHSARYHDAGAVASRAMEIIRRLESERDQLLRQIDEMRCLKEDRDRWRKIARQLFRKVNFPDPIARAACVEACPGIEKEEK